MPNDALRSPFEQSMIDHLRSLGFQYTFSIQADCILCHDTQGCYPADSFRVIELHAFGPEKNTRNLIYGILFDDGEKGVILGIAHELNDIEDPELYAKLMVL